MQKRFFIGLVLLGLCCKVYAQILPNLGGQRAGLSALGFLKNDLNPASLALGNTGASQDGNGFSVLNNPAALTGLNNYTLSVAHLLAGAGIHQSYLGSFWKLKNEALFGVSVNSLNTGPMDVRTEFQPGGTGQQFYFSNTKVGLSYALKLSDMFSLGGTVGYINEQIANYSNHTLTADIGFLYETDIRDLQFAVSILNFGGSSNVTGEDYPVDYNRTGVETLKYTTPIVFQLGASMVPWEKEKQSIITSIQLNHPNDNAENIGIGVAYNYAKLLEVRLGYRLSVKGKSLPSLGFGLKSRLGIHTLKFSYAAVPTSWMGTQHLAGIQLEWNNDKRE